MATLNMLITNDGLISAILAQQREGWYIKPYTFSVSDTAGDLVKTRTEASKNTVWYTAPISSVITNYPNGLTFVCSIPPGTDTIDHAIAELYITAQDSVGSTFLLGIAHPQSDAGDDSTLFYDHGGTLTIRIMMTLQNADLSTIMDINYTQATEMSEHELTEDAHYSTIQRALHKAGIFVQDTEFEYEGQTWDEDVTVNGTVFNGAIVTPDVGFYKACTVATCQSFVGVALHYKGAKQWVANTSYAYGELVYPPTLNNHTYKCTVAGTSNSSQPVWPTTTSGTVTDNEVTWQEATEWFVIFSGLVKFPSALIPADATTLAPLYLSTTTAGTLTLTANTVLIGLYLGNDVVYVFPSVDVMPLSYLDTDGTMAANSDIRVASQKAVVTYCAKKAGDATQAFSANDGSSNKQVVNISQFGSSIGANGYQRLPSGLIIQWGSHTGGSGYANITFPLQFPHAVYSVTVTDMATSVVTTDIDGVGSLTTSGMRVWCSTDADNNAGADFYWMAIGY
jgi:hypothetical protein